MHLFNSAFFFFASWQQKWVSWIQISNWLKYVDEPVQVHDQKVQHKTLYFSTSSAWGKWWVAINRWTKLDRMPFLYKLLAIIRLTKFLPQPVQPCKLRTSALGGLALEKCPLIELTTVLATRCWPCSCCFRSYSSPVINTEHSDLIIYCTTEKIIVSVECCLIWHNDKNSVSCWQTNNQYGDVWTLLTLPDNWTVSSCSS